MVARYVGSVVLAVAFSAVSSHVLGQSLPPGSVAPQLRTAESAKAEARASFDRGITLFDNGAYDAALVEFQRARRLFPTRSASRNAELALRKLHRFDEALDIVEELLRESSLSDAERRGLVHELHELTAVVGTLAVGCAESDAAVLINGIERGKTPLPRPIRMSAGTHVVRVFKEGFLPYETRVEVAGQENATVSATLHAFMQGGRLAVSEDRGAAVHVVVDGIVTGTTPWEGTLPVGPHTVWLKGDGDVGSPPASIDVALNRLSKLSLVSEPVPCALRVEPTPVNARVALDGVDVGSGVFRGSLRCGGHVVELAAPGFLPTKKTLSLSKDIPFVFTDSLDRDPNSALFRAANPSRVTFDLRAGVPTGASLGGSLAGGSQGPVLGLAVQAGAGYQLGSGFGLSLDVGFLTVGQSINQRSASAFPIGLAPQPGEVRDELGLSGPMLGVSLALERGERVVWSGRLGAGAFLGSWSDVRSGAFTTAGGLAYAVPAVTERGEARFAYLNPEVRIGLRLSKHIVAQVGIQALALLNTSSATWSDSKPFLAGQCPSPDIRACAGLAGYGASKVVGTSLLALPFIGVRYEL